MNALKYIIALILGGISALIIGKIWTITGTSTTVDAWLVSFTISGHDVGDRMSVFMREMLRSTNNEYITSLGDLFGKSLAEECMKFFMFLIAFFLIKPVSVREIIFMGICVGLGFAMCESFVFHESDFIHPGLFVRSIGHSLFTGILTMLFGYGYFSQLRWIDAGAKENLMTRILQYSELVILTFWTLFGLIIAACLHAVVNILLAGETSIIWGFWVLVISWFLFGKALVQPGSKKPYGTLIQEVHLLHTISEAQKDLTDIQKKTGKMRKEKKT